MTGLSEQLNNISLFAVGCSSLIEDVKRFILFLGMGMRIFVRKCCEHSIENDGSFFS